MAKIIQINCKLLCSVHPEKIRLTMLTNDLQDKYKSYYSMVSVQECFNLPCTLSSANTLATSIISVVNHSVPDFLCKGEESTGS